MAKSLHALIYPSAPNTICERRMIDLADVPAHKRAWWRPVVVVGDDSFDPATHKKTGPVTTIEAARVVDAFTVSALTQAEIDARKDAKISAIDMLQFEIAFDMENRVRALESKAAITRAQYRNALRARL